MYFKLVFQKRLPDEMFPPMMTGKIVKKKKKLEKKILVKNKKKSFKL